MDSKQIIGLLLTIEGAIVGGLFFVAGIGLMKTVKSSTSTGDGGG